MRHRNQSVQIYNYLTTSVQIYNYLTTSVQIYNYLTTSVQIYNYLTTSVQIYNYLTTSDFCSDFLFLIDSGSFPEHSTSCCSGSGSHWVSSVCLFSSASPLIPSSSATARKLWRRACSMRTLKNGLFSDKNLCLLEL